MPILCSDAALSAYNALTAAYVIYGDRTPSLQRWTAARQWRTNAHVIGPAKIYFIIFGLLTIAGGVLGYVKAGSTASIIAGSISGALLLLAAFLLPQQFAIALVLAALVSIALAGRFVPAFLQTGKMMPAGMMAILSVIGLVMAIVAWIKK